MIPFTQTCLHGRTSVIGIERSSSIERMAEELYSRGFRFFVAMVDGDLVFTCRREFGGTSYAVGADQCRRADAIGIDDAIDRMVMESYVRATRGAMPEDLH
jgi:hypothetical protein